MPVTMEQVRQALEPDELNYHEAARLGPEAVPHLLALVRGPDPMLAAKATYLASLIRSADSVRVTEEAARHSDPVVRVAAASAARNLSGKDASAVLDRMLADPDLGVRKVALKSVAAAGVSDLSDRVQKLAEADTDVAIRAVANETLKQLHKR